MGPQPIWKRWRREKNPFTTAEAKSEFQSHVPVRNAVNTHRAAFILDGNVIQRHYSTYAVKLVILLFGLPTPFPRIMMMLWKVSALSITGNGNVWVGLVDGGGGGTPLERNIVLYDGGGGVETAATHAPIPSSVPAMYCSYNH
jgi:hypothetical protein